MDSNPRWMASGSERSNPVNENLPRPGLLKVGDAAPRAMQLAVFLVTDGLARPRFSGGPRES